jgi:GT2 family glycosyltransferase
MSTTRISVVTPVYNPVLAELRDCLKSAQGPEVEHILALDGSKNVKNLGALRRLVKKFGASLVICEEQGGISSASNKAATAAKGEFLVFLDQDDFLVKNWWAPTLEIMGEADFIYSDAFLADESGKPFHYWKKPGWSPHRLVFNMYAVHFMAVRKSVFEKVGGFRSKFDGSQDHDLALRVSRESNRVKHIPTPLYNWRASKASTASNPENKKWAFDAGLAAAQEHISFYSKGASLEKIEGYPGALRPRYTSRTEPVSVVIPTAFSSSSPGSFYVDSLLQSLIPFLSAELGDQIVLVHGGEEHSSFVDQLQSTGKIEILSVKDDDQFNFSQRCNIGFLMAKHEHVLLLNDDIEFGEENPLDNLFGTLKMPNVGLVGALLVFPDFSIQHGGHAFTDGDPHHAHYGAKSLSHGLMDLVVDHEVVGVTGALMFQLKSTWKAVGGFSTQFPLNYNDVDYCQKVRTLGYSIIQANSVTAVHHESVTREPIIEDYETNLIRQRWPDVLRSDEFSTTD